MRELEYGKLADEVKELQSDMRRLEITAVAAAGAVTAFLLTESYGKNFLFFGSLVPLLITLGATLRYVAYFYQLKRIRRFLATKEVADGYDGWETFLLKDKDSVASRLATLSSIAFWSLLLVFSCALFLTVLAYDRRCNQPNNALQRTAQKLRLAALSVVL